MQRGSGSNTQTRYPSRCAAKQNMRPNWPPPSMPSQAVGRMGIRDSDMKALKLGLGGARGDRGQCHCAGFFSLLLPECIELARERRKSAAEHRNCKKRGIRGARFANCKSRHRDAFGHLDNRMQCIYSLQMRARNRYAEDGRRRFRRKHARQMRCAEITRVSTRTSKWRNISTARFITVQSETEPITTLMKGRGCVSGMAWVF